MAAARSRQDHVRAGLADLDEAVRPELDEAVAKGIGLQLSGHTHGGQLFPITGLVRALYTYSAGLYRVGDGHVYVHRGTGFCGPPMRIGSPRSLASRATALM